MVFKIVCWGFEVPFTVRMFFSFYATRSSKGDWVTLYSLLGKALFKPYSNHYKNLRDKFVREKGRQGSHVVVEKDGDPLFPLSQTYNLVAITGYDYKYLTSRNAKMVCLLKKFDVMESSVVIEWWREGGDSLEEYMSKLGYLYTFIGILGRHLTFIYFLLYQMANISLEVRKKRQDKIRQHMRTLIALTIILSA